MLENDINHSFSFAYQLELPAHAHLHDCFHVSLLKPYKGPTWALIPSLPSIFEREVIPTPHQVLWSCWNNDSLELLIEWQRLPASEATWEPLELLQAAYLDCELEDKLTFQGGSDVRDPPIMHFPNRVLEALGIFYITFRILCFYLFCLDIYLIYLPCSLCFWFSHILFRFISLSLGMSAIFWSLFKWLLWINKAADRFSLWLVYSSLRC